MIISVLVNGSTTKLAKVLMFGFVIVVVFAVDCFYFELCNLSKSLVSVYNAGW